MEFGRFRFARRGGLFAFALLALCSTESKAWQQQSSASAPAQATVPSLPAAQPLTEAARGTASQNARPAAPSGSDPSIALAPAVDNSLVRLEPGDLLEVGVYNVPELSTKARIGNSGDVYLPLIDYVHVADLTVE